MKHFKSVVLLIALFALLLLVLPVSAQETIVIPNGTELATSGDFANYALVLGSVVVVLGMFVALSVLVAYLAKNNVKLIDPSTLKDLISPVGAQVLQGAYTRALSTKESIDEDIVLGVARLFYTVTQNADGTITLGRQTPTVAELDRAIYNRPPTNVSNPNPLGQ